MIRHLEIFEKVTVRYDHSIGYLYIDDYDTGEQLVVFHVENNITIGKE